MEHGAAIPGHVARSSSPAVGGSFSRNWIHQLLISLEKAWEMDPLHYPVDVVDAFRIGLQSHLRRLKRWLWLCLTIGALPVPPWFQADLLNSYHPAWQNAGEKRAPFDRSTALQAYLLVRSSMKVAPTSVSCRQGGIQIQPLQIDCWDQVA